MNYCFYVWLIHSASLWKAVLNVKGVHGHYNWHYHQYELIHLLMMPWLTHFVGVNHVVLTWIGVGVIRGGFAQKEAPAINNYGYYWQGDQHYLLMVMA